HQKLSVFCKFQYLRVWTAIATDPDIALVVDEYPVIRIRPFISFAGPAPMPQQVARLIELEHRWRPGTAFTCLQFQWSLIDAKCRGTAMDNPHVVVRVDPDSNRRAQNPMIWKRLGPQWVDFE